MEEKLYDEKSGGLIEHFFKRCITADIYINNGEITHEQGIEYLRNSHLLVNNKEFLKDGSVRIIQEV